MERKSIGIGLFIALLLIMTVLQSGPVSTSPGPSGRRDMTSEQGEEPAEEEREQTGAAEAEALWRAKMQDENGSVRPDGLVKAIEQVRVMRLNQASLGSAGAGVEPMQWTWLGPGNIGGRVRALLIHPTNPNIIWAGSDTGGIWKTGNGGSTWQPVDDFMASLNISTLVMHPANPDLIYAGTGGLRGAGVFKSNNGGVTWAQLEQTTPTNPNWRHVNRLAISPDGAVLLAANGVYWDDSTKGGIWRSTNGGANWTQVLSAQAIDIDFHPTNSRLAVASGYGQAWYSTDGGVTWTRATGLTFSSPSYEQGQLAYAPGTPNIVYAFFNRNQADGRQQGEIWRSLTGGQSYTLVNGGNEDVGSLNIIWADPTNANFLIVGYVDLWRSLDGGATLTRISDWTEVPNSPHADQHAIMAHPGFNGRSNRILYIGNDGGIYKTDNIYTVQVTAGWQALNNNLGITQFYSAAGDPATGVIIGGTQDNGTLLYRGSPTGWNQWAGGDGGYTAVDVTRSIYLYGECQWLDLFRSADGGQSTEPINGDSSHWQWDGSQWVWIKQWKSAPYLIPDVRDGKTLFIAPFMLDPNNPDRLLAGGQSLWRSNDVRTPNTPTAGPAWQRIKPPVGDNCSANPYRTEHCISTIAVARGNSDLIWVGYGQGQIYKTTNGTAITPTWIRIDSDTLENLPDRFVTRLTIDPHNPNLVYAAFGGFSPDNLWRTTDGGLTWRDISGSGASGLPEVPVYSLAINPNQPIGYTLVPRLAFLLRKMVAVSGFCLKMDRPMSASTILSG